MTMATDPHIESSTAHGVCTVRIERPAKRNALTASMYAALAAAFIAADADESVRAVVFTGNPQAFTGGNDLADFLHQPPSRADAPVFRFMRALSDCRKPVVAAVCGPAVGIGKVQPQRRPAQPLARRQRAHPGGLQRGPRRAQRHPAGWRHAAHRGRAHL